MLSITSIVIVFPQSAVCNNKYVYVLFDFKNYDEDKNYYTENMLWKGEKNGKVEFSIGSETMGPIYYFIFDNVKSKKQLLTETEFKKFVLIPFEEFKRDFVKNKKNKLAVSVVEITKEGKVFLYKNVDWDRTDYIE